MKPSTPPAQLQQALVHHQAGRLDEADRLYRLLRTTQPRCYEAWHHSGLIALARNKPAEALPLFAQAVALQPRVAEAQVHLGIAQRACGRGAEALRALRTAVQLKPDFAEAWHQLGVTQQNEGHLAEAAQAFKKASDLKPQAAESIEALGAMVSESQGPAAALPYFEEATRREPKRATPWCNLGIAYCYLRHYEKALQSLEKALALDPSLVKAHSGRALALQRLYHLREAAEAFRKATEIAPRDTEAWSGRLLTQHYLDDVTPEELAREHAAFGAAMAPLVQPLPPPRPQANRRLRLGILSQDLRRHAVASFLLPLLRHADRTRFELFLYHDHSSSDEVTKEFQQLADHWRHVAGLGHAVVEKQLRSDELDLLLDLAGHTGVNRLQVLARRVAPCQVTYLGYPNTTGLKTMDVRFTDAYADPVGETEGWHSERLVRFSAHAWAFQPPEQSPDTAPLLAAEAPLRLGCFNNYAKVSPTTLRLWARLLEALPEATLCLKAHDLDQASFMEEARRRLEKAGIPAARVEFLGRTPDTPSHLAAYKRIDLSLDPFPYHGTTSTCEALWMGVPVVSLAGRAHVSRVAVSLLTAVGRPEWVAYSEDEYIKRVIELADGRTRSVTFREDLRRALSASPLLDHPGQAARFFDALAGCCSS